MVSPADLTDSQTQISLSFFYNNSATGTTQGYGGALYVQSSSATISGCYFEGNIGLQGGAAYLDTSDNQTISGCTFHNNSASRQNLKGATTDDNGGAVYLSGQISNMYLISNSNFTSNQAEASAGAIDAFEVSGKVDIRGCTFVGDSAGTAYGVVIYVYRSLQRLTSVFLRDSTFVGNNRGQAGSVYLRSCSCVGVIGNKSANSDATPLSIADVGRHL